MTVDERESLVNDLCMGFMTLGADMAELKNMLYVILEPYEITTRSTAVAEVTLELPDLEDTTGPARCITGQSGSGICGAAAYCDQPYDCCAQCDEDCNGRCGWIPRTERTETEEVATPQEKVVYANRAYIKAPPYHLPKFDLQEALGYLRVRQVKGLSDGPGALIEKEYIFVKKYPHHYSFKDLSGFQKSFTAQELREIMVR